MNMRKAQRGVTGAGWLIILAIIGFFILLLLKLGPIYLDHYRVKATLESLKEEPLITQKTPREIRTLLKKRFDVNYVTSVTPDDLEIKRKPGILEVTLDYEARTGIIGNVDALVSFSDHVEIVGN